MSKLNLLLLLLLLFLFSVTFCPNSAKQSKRCEPPKDALVPFAVLKGLELVSQGLVVECQDGSDSWVEWDSSHSCDSFVVSHWERLTQFRIVQKEWRAQETRRLLRVKEWAYFPLGKAQSMGNPPRHDNRPYGIRGEAPKRPQWIRMGRGVN